VRVARSIPDLDALAHSWAAIGVGYVDAELDYFSAVAQHRDEVIHPHVILLEDDHGPRSLAVGWIEQSRLACRIGYKVVYRPALKILRVAHGGIAGAPDEASAADVVRELNRALANGEADLLLVPAVRIDCSLDLALRGLSRRLRVERPRRPAVHRTLALPATYDEFLARRDAKSRYNLKRASANLEKTFADRLDVSVLAGPESFERIFGDLEHVAAKTYQRGLGAGFADTPDRRAYVRVALARGEFRAWMLSIDGVPIAFWQGIVRRNTFVLSNAGYDPAYGRLGVGTYVQMRMFRDLIEDPLIDVVDFGWGDADYKARFGTESWLEHDVLIYAPSFKGMRVRVLRGMVLGVDRLARRAVDRLGVLDTVKRVWRVRLRRSASVEAGALHSPG
jgi:CelD/BcsL family acetyltransferase involved in cellulose biosynthesis